MRGAARVGGRAFRPTPSKTPKNNSNPFDLLKNQIEDLPVAPALEPINDEWSWSLGADPADPRDCSRYPASPYCGEIPFEFGKPFGFTPELKSNGCETCVYVYPVILWLKTTPQVICHRDPNCDRTPPPLNKDPLTKNKPPRYPENVSPNRYKSPSCARRESVINAWHNWNNDTTEQSINQNIEQLTAQYPDVKIRIEAGEAIESDSYPDPCAYDLSSPFRDPEGGFKFFTLADKRILKNIYLYWEYTYNFGQIGSGYLVREFRSWIPSNCCGMPQEPKILPPPPVPPFNDRPPQNRKKGKDMCCNDCADSKDNTEKLLREIKEMKKALGTGKLEKALDAAVGIGDSSVTAIVNLIAKRLGTSSYPIEVPESLLSGNNDDKTFKAESNAEYLFWLTKQLDGLVGEFPIEIEVKDIDPLTKGDQKQKIEIPNLAEAIAEIYGLVAKGAVNQEVDQAFLLRIATEVIAAKNGIAITQDYVKANAKFLGYKGNPVDRELQYNFDFSKIVLGQKDQEVKVDEILRTVKGYVKGWENQDKETAANFFMKLMFSAGIIKSVFFRNKKQMKEVIEKADEMLKDRLKVEDNWKGFLKDVNDPNSPINKDQSQPEIKDETK